MSSALELSIAINLEDLLSIEGQWQELWLDSPCGTPFQSPAWLIPFVRIFSPAEIRVLLIWRKDQLVGLFPFWIERGFGPFTIKILGHGISDYLDALGREAEWHNLPPLIEAWLNQELGSEGSVEFGQLKQNALLASVPRAGIFEEETSWGEVCPVVPLRGERTAAVVPSALRSNLESVFRQAEKSGRPLDFEIANDDSFEEAITLLYHLHTKRWQRRGSAGIFATKQQRDFYRQAFKSLHAAAAIKIFVLRLGGNPVAALVAFIHKRILYYYIGAFDPDYAKFSPGNLIILRAIEFAGRAGCHSFDFLRGREAYKYRWGARDQETVIRKLRRSPKEPGNGQ
ncbi:MAG: GNAT family N-acetyltransferase [Verrucomicrobia bacterium]|nr:GNAT family N-acetyltransferase [Verrucomicrobiota bacterium]